MAYDRDLEFVYRNPTKLVFREGALSDLGVEIDELKCKKAFVVTDKGIVDAGLIEGVEKVLSHRHVGTFDGCIQDSGYHIINEAAGLAKEKEADILVSVGGGSVIDTTKGMAILLKEGGKLEDYAGFQMLTGPQTPHIVIPTTAGTGSEVTYTAVVKDWEQNFKMFISDNNIIPNVAILDPKMTQGLPPMLTATTGMDALTHAIEAITAMVALPIADYLAFGAIRMIVEYLPKCVEDGSDLFARGQQQIAATMAGIAFATSQVGLVHALAHVSGGLFGVPHGLANSIFLPHVMKFNMEECPDRYALVAEAMGVKEKGMSDLEATEAAIKTVFELAKKLGIPQKLRETSCTEEGLPEAADKVLSDGSVIYNARPVLDMEEVLEIYKKAW
jgi:aldehyde dehydrogenase (NAD+)